jgi:hypothetical protein
MEATILKPMPDHPEHWQLSALDKATLYGEYQLLLQIYKGEHSWFTLPVLPEYKEQNWCALNYKPAHYPDMIITCSGYGILPNGDTVVASIWQLLKLKAGINPNMGYFNHPEQTTSI